MRVLHIVERDAGTLVLATSDGHEKFGLPLDDALRTALDDAPAGAAPSPRAQAEPRITPREIQTRVRAGESPDELAETFDTPLHSIMRFAGPVLAERELITGEAHRAKARRSTTEGQVVVFGETVDARFAAHGIDPRQVRWDARRPDGGQWIVTAGWIGGQSERSAEWGFQLAARMVAPLDDTAADLLSDRPIRPVLAPPEPGTAPALTLAPPMPDADTGPLPRTEEEVFDQAQYEQDGSGATPAAGPVETPPLPMQVPGTPDAPTESAAQPAETTRIPKVTNLGVAARKDRKNGREDKPARPTVPSWDDILLGARRKQD